MRKFRASLEPFWDLKISKYVEYLTRVSSEYITSWALLSVRSTVGWTSRVFLAYVMPWINKASLALYIARIVTRGCPARDCSSVTNLKFGRNTVLSSSSLWLKHRNLSLSRLRVDLRRHLHDFWGEHRSMCTHSIDDFLPHAPLHYAATGEMVKGSLHITFLADMGRNFKRYSGNSSYQL